MATFGIYFVNQTGSSSKYALFTQPPATASTSGSTGTCFSNVFMTNALDNDGDWNITINKTYYAWCGTAASQFAPGVVVQSGMGKPVTLGTGTSPGSTWTVFNNNGKPSFNQTPTYTSRASAFEIDTGTDFTAQQDFLIGMGNPDSNGIMRPVATMLAKPNFNVNFTPINRYWIGAFDSTVGTVFDSSSFSAQFADINFSANPGMFGAIVKQDVFGKWSVSYVNQLSFAFEVIQNQAKIRGSAWLVNALKAQCETIQENLIEAGDDSGPAVINRDRYIGMVAILKSTPTWQQFLTAISTRFTNDWQYESGTLSPDGTKVRVTFSHGQPSNITGARSAFQSTWSSLPEATKAAFVDPQVIEYSSGLDLVAPPTLQQQSQQTLPLQQLQPQQFQGPPLQNFGAGNFIAATA